MSSSYRRSLTNVIYNLIFSELFALCKILLDEKFFASYTFNSRKPRYKPSNCLDCAENFYWYAHAFLPENDTLYVEMNLSIREYSRELLRITEKEQDISIREFQEKVNSILKAFKKEK
ncbi:hypothetical protein ACTFIW_005433 [Dictyostelium discoideum]